MADSWMEICQVCGKVFSSMAGNSIRESYDHGCQCRKENPNHPYSKRSSAVNKKMADKMMVGWSEVGKYLFGYKNG